MSKELSNLSKVINLVRTHVRVQIQILSQRPHYLHCIKMIQKQCCSGKAGQKALCEVGQWVERRSSVTQDREHQEEKARETENVRYNFSLYHAFV